MSNFTETNHSSNNQKNENQIIEPFNGYNVIQKTCFNCGKKYFITKYFITKDMMNICTMPCPFCGVDLCNPTC